MLRQIHSNDPTMNSRQHPDIASSLNRPGISSAAKSKASTIDKLDDRINKINQKIQRRKTKIDRIRTVGLQPLFGGAEKLFKPKTEEEIANKLSKKIRGMV